MHLFGYFLSELLYTNESTRVHRGRRASDDLPVVFKQARDPSFAARLKPRLTHELTVLRQLEAVACRYALRPVELIDSAELCALVTHDTGGRALRDCLSGGERLPLRTTMDLGRRLSMALGDMHAAGWVHRDLNPGNVVYTPETDDVCLIDFGIAMEVRHPTPPGVHGTPAYLAPEQTGRLSHGVDHRTDLYALGVLLYELLSGKRPHTATEMQELMRQILTERPPPLHTLMEIPRPLSDVVAKLMHKEPERRYQSAFGVERDLVRCLQGDTDIAWPVGAEDRTAAFKLSGHLHGRDTELQTLRELQQRADAGACEVAFLRGSAGAGKSALVGALKDAAVRDGAWFAEGKFEQLQRQIPFGAISQAVNAMVRRLLATPEQELLLWRRRFNALLGSSGGALLPVVPDLQRLTGPLAAVRDLPSEQAEARLLWLLQKVLRVLCEQRLFVLHIDDLQWADPGTCKLIERLACDTETRRLLLVSSYRIEESAGPDALVERLHAAGCTPTTVAVLPMGLPQVTAWLQELTGAAPSAAHALAELVLAKTQGNPFFIRHFLQELHVRALLAYDSRSGRWVWDVERIARANVTDNVVELLASKLAALPSALQRLLGWAACYAGEISAEELSEAFALDTAETVAALDRLAHQEIIVESPPNDLPGLSEVQRRFAFSHDRLQAAAYALLDSDETAHAHALIGRQLWRLGPREAPFRALSHLNRAHAVLTAEERQELARLNLRGAVAAKQALAYEMGYGFTKNAMDLLGDDAWRIDAEMRHQLASEALQLAVIMGHQEEARQHLDDALEHARDANHQADLHRRHAVSLQSTGRYADSTRAVLQTMRVLGIKVPERPHAGHVVIALIRLKVKLGRRDIETLPDLPFSTEARQRLFLDVIGENSHALYFYDTNLFILLGLTAARLVLEHGNVPCSGIFFSVVGAVFYVLRDSTGGRKWLAAAQRFSTSLDPPHPSVGNILCVQGLMQDYATLSPHELVGQYRTASRLSMEHGEINYATIAPMLAFLIASVWSLDELRQEMERHQDICKRSREAILQFQCMRQFDKMVRGETNAPDSYGDDAGCEDNALLQDVLACNTVALITYWVQKVMGCWANGCVEATLSGARRAIEAGLYEKSGEQTPSIVSLFIVLACAESAWRHPKRVLPEKRMFKRAIAWIAGRLADPNGRLHGICLLAQAEQAVLERDVARPGAFEAAATALAASGYHALAGDAFERWGRYHLRRGDGLAAAAPLLQATRSFEAWGSLYRAQRVHDELLAPLLSRFPGLQGGFSDPLSTTSRTGVDTLTQREGRNRSGDPRPRTAAALAHALGNEVDLDTTIRLILDEVRRVTSATHCVYAVWDASAGRFVPRDATTPDQPLPFDLLSYVARTREPLLVDGTAQAQDLDLKLPPVASMLAVPVAAHGRILGVMYVENEESPRSLGHAVEACEALAVELALSHENHLLRSAMDVHVRSEVDKTLRAHARAVEDARASTSIAMAGGFAHEMRNALAPAQYALEWLASADVLSAETSEVVLAAREGVERGLRVAATTLAYAQASEVRPGAETTTLATVVDAVLSDLRAGLDDDHIAVQVDVAAELHVVIKADHIATILRHLVSNARDAVRGGGAAAPCIWVRGAADAEGVVVTVRDNGRGITTEQRARLFEPFFSTKGADGLGLGLGLSQRIIAAYGGHIEAESSGEGQGASFKVVIPPLRAE
jgi:histidine kinase